MTTLWMLLRRPLSLILLCGIRRRRHETEKNAAKDAALLVIDRLIRRSRCACEHTPRLHLSGKWRWRYRLCQPTSQESRLASYF
jgi:hypothetical protein